MKNTILITALFAFFIVSCNNHQAGTHTHEDGTTHSDCGHDHSDGEKHEQEEFVVGSDSTHDCGHEHSGEDEHNHEH